MDWRHWSAEDWVRHYAASAPTTVGQASDPDLVYHAIQHPLDTAQVFIEHPIETAHKFLDTPMATLRSALNAPGETLHSAEHLVETEAERAQDWLREKERKAEGTVKGVAFGVIALFGLMAVTAAKK